MSLRSRLFSVLIVLGVCLTACEDTSTDIEMSDIPARLRLEVVIPEAGPALRLAAQDLEFTVQQVTGAEGEPTHTVRVDIQADAGEFGSEGYSIQSVDDGLEVRAGSELGAAYALYHIAGDLGARYIHPEETHFISNEDLELPSYDGTIELPHFEMRGFHEHTQHPIVMSDFLLRPGRDDFRAFVSHYLKWLVRNRQNTLSFHMLNTVDLDAWLPYITDIIGEAEGYGIDMGLVLGFVDQQQNAYRLVKPASEDPEEVQITTQLDRILAAGFKQIGFQIGTSEFTKPDEEVMLTWLNLAVEHINIQHPTVQPYAWIHITCELDGENGKPYYHLPLIADEHLGAYVHTTMFYSIEHPAPVYECETFQHQKDFFNEADGQRPLVFFPETSWWLGFDNNIPLVNPITGRSREYDILEELPAWSVMGHLTFTTGREWTYWQYDHYLTQVTWTGTTSWDDYLQWLAPIYGDGGTALMASIQSWGDRQWTDLYVEHPEIYFYLAGELPQDELGEQAGIIARRPKIAFRKILEMDDDAFAEWTTRDLDYLRQMHTAYGHILEGLPNDSNEPIWLEVRTGYRLFVERIAHAINLYEGVVAIRAGDRAEAEKEHLDAVRIGGAARLAIASVEENYRYPAEVLTDEKPESLTAYPFGYLHETSSAYFWLRREAQLAQLITDVFDAPPEEWGRSVTSVNAGRGEDLDVLAPMNPVLANALSGFIPQILVARADVEAEDDSLTFGFAQDQNANGEPDVGTVAFFGTGPLMDGEWVAQVPEYALLVRDGGGASIGSLTLSDAVFTLEQDDESDFSSIEIVAQVNSENIVTLVRSVAGIEADALAQLLKSVWGLPLDEELPARLPMTIRFPLNPI